jgi:hypothetical protein
MEGVEWRFCGGKKKKVIVSIREQNVEYVTS